MPMGLGINLRIGRGGRVAAAPLGLAWQVDPANTQPITLVNNADGSATVTRNSGTQGVNTALVRSIAAITGDYVLEMEMLNATTTNLIPGVDDTLPTAATFFANSAVFSNLLQGNGQAAIYEGAAAQINNPGAWSPGVGGKFWQARIVTTTYWNAGAFPGAAAAVVAPYFSKADTTAPRYAGFDFYDNASSVKLRFYAL